MDNPGEKIGAGLLARVSFDASADTNVVVPESAIVDEDAIFVVTKAGEKDVLERRSVTLGQTANGKVEIVAGLAPQERFVVRSSRRYNRIAKFASAFYQKNSRNNSVNGDC
ncbi:hypothetical protein NON20_19880 [Synechocystis sp. B12]|nr:hypothetical protein NON20_19880 [Synechocystis sp. B12]